MRESQHVWEGEVGWRSPFVPLHLLHPSSLLDPAGTKHDERRRSRVNIEMKIKSFKTGETRRKKVASPCCGVWRNWWLTAHYCTFPNMKSHCTDLSRQTFISLLGFVWVRIATQPHQHGWYFQCLLCYLKASHKQMQEQWTWRLEWAWTDTFL